MTSAVKPDGIARRSGMASTSMIPLSFEKAGIEVVNPFEGGVEPATRPAGLRSFRILSILSHQASVPRLRAISRMMSFSRNIPTSSSFFMTGRVTTWFVTIF